MSEDHCDQLQYKNIIPSIQTSQLIQDSLLFLLLNILSIIVVRKLKDIITTKNTMVIYF